MRLGSLRFSLSIALLGYATPHANTLVDVVSLDLANTPAGTYSITLEVRDRVTGVAYTRTSTVTIAK